MENYTYKGMSEGKYVSGEIEAANLNEATNKLKAKKALDQVYLKKKLHHKTQ